MPFKQWNHIFRHPLWKYCGEGMGELCSYQWTNLVARVIWQARNDGSLGKAAIAKDGQLGWILGLSGKIAWTLWIEYQRDSVRGTKVLRMISCTWHKQLDTWHQGRAYLVDYFGNWGKVSSAMFGNWDKEKWEAVRADRSRECPACLWLFLPLLQIRSWQLPQKQRRLVGIGSHKNIEANTSSRRSWLLPVGKIRCRNKNHFIKLRFIPRYISFSGLGNII